MPATTFGKTIGKKAKSPRKAQKQPQQGGSAFLPVFLRIFGKC